MSALPTHPVHDSTFALLDDARRRAFAYLSTVDDRRVAPPEEAVDNLNRLRHPLPERGLEAAEVLRLLDEIGSPATVATLGGRYFGFVTGGALPVTLATRWITDCWDQNVALRSLSPVGAAMEEVVLEWLADVLGIPAGGGTFVTGGSIANFTALAAARHQVLKQVGWNVEADGLFGAPPITVVVGAEAHMSIPKSLAMLGLGRERVVTVPTDSKGRMRPDALPKLSGPTVLCAQAGSVDGGSFDPLSELADAVHEVGGWLHVDGAYGLWAAASPRLRPLIAGVEKADSWAVDGHKWLNSPYDCGVALVRKPEALRGAMGFVASYLPPASAREPSQYAPELSRRARSIEMWAAMLHLGKEGIAELVDRTCRHARRFAEGLAGAGFEILGDVIVNQVLVSFGSDEMTDRVIRGIQEEGTCWCGGTFNRGKRAMRISVSSWATTEADVEASLEAMIRIAREF